MRRARPLTCPVERLPPAAVHLPPGDVCPQHGQAGERSGATGLQHEQYWPKAVVQELAEQHERAKVAFAHPAANAVKAVSRWLN